METEHAAAEPAHESEAEHAPEHTAESSSFWKSVPGILTACTSLVVALSGLVAGLGQAGIIGHKKVDAHAVASASPPPPTTSTATPTAIPLAQREDDDDPGLRPYYVNSPGDGFSWVRKGPTKDSEGVATLASGTLVRCRDAVPDPDPDTGRSWNFCPKEEGYISARLLKPARVAR